MIIITCGCLLIFVGLGLDIYQAKRKKPVWHLMQAWSKNEEGRGMVYYYQVDDGPICEAITNLPQPMSTIWHDFDPSSDRK